MNFAIYKYPFGFLKIEYQDDSVLQLKNLPNNNNINDFGKQTLFTDLVYSQIIEYLTGKRFSFDFKYILQGTEFQMKVWKELSNIPYGETRTYKDISISVGRPNASRAIGMASNKNPIILVIPCHRVVGSNGSLTGYAGGIEMKQTLLTLEKNINIQKNKIK